MGNPTYTEINPNYGIENPTAPRDLGLLVYFVKEDNENGFINFYNETIKKYLESKHVKDVVVWNYKYNGQIMFVFATSPTIPPWLGVPELAGLEKFVDPNLPSVFERRRGLDMHLQEYGYPLGEK